jgi:hypothetical protein
VSLWVPSKFDRGAVDVYLNGGMLLELMIVSLNSVRLLFVCLVELEPDGVADGVLLPLVPALS